MLRALTLISALPIFLLLAGCDAGGGTDQGCQDTIMEEKIDEIEGIKDTENAKDEVVNLGDTVQLLNRRGTDGRCTVSPASWNQTPDCANDIFRAMRHNKLICRPVGADGIEFVRLAIPAALPTDNSIATIRVVNAQWNGLARIVERVGDDSVSRVPLFKTVTTETENEDGTLTTEDHCELDDRHIEIRGNYIFEKVVEFIVQTLQVSNTCTPTKCQALDLTDDYDVNPAEWVRCPEQNIFPPEGPPPLRFQPLQHSSLVCRPIADGLELVRHVAGCDVTTIMTLRGVRELQDHDTQLERDGDDIVSRIHLHHISSIIGMAEAFDPNYAGPGCPHINLHLEIRGKAAFQKVVDFVTRTTLVSYGPCAP